MKQTSKRATFFSSALVVVIVFLSFFLLMPTADLDDDKPETSFATARALKHVKEISKKPHYIGSDAHSEVKEYVQAELEILGLETQLQEDFTLNEEWGVLAKPKNILARIPGKNKNGKALLLLAHYDSAPHSFSYGASDAGSGVAAILESVRAYLAGGNTPENDIIILFSDAEEIGLVGAKLFVNKHPWAKNVGLVVNFEARGSGGPSNMIVETNGGNSGLIREFKKANPSHPVATSLMYSVYKMLPNDTDSTVFREDGDIDSFFFAFIDDHYDYHTANDTYENLDRNTLEHQGSYATALLNYFSKSDLSDLKAEDDSVYFNVPWINLISYPFSWVFPMLLLAWILFFMVVFYGLASRTLSKRAVFKCSRPFFTALLLCGAVTFFGWKALVAIYPEYNEILHGFTYNGHYYIAAFVALSLAICFWAYKKFHRKESIANVSVAPIFVWLVINTVIAFYIKGAGYFIIPVYFGIFGLLVLLKQKANAPVLFTLLGIPALVIFAPLVQFFPVGLGLKMLVLSAVFTVLLFGLLVPVFAAYRRKKAFSLGFFLLAIAFFIAAHVTSSFSPERQKPNSLVYFYDSDTEEGYWTTYDISMDSWTNALLGENAETASEKIKNVTSSKYGTAYTLAKNAPDKNIPPPEIAMTRDTVVGNFREVGFTVVPQRNVNRIALFADKETVFRDLEVNGQAFSKNASTGNAVEHRTSNNLLNYYVSDGNSLEVFYRVHETQKAEIILQEISFDLLEDTNFSVPKRGEDQIPKPFVTTDAILVQKKVPSGEPTSLIKETPENDEGN